MAIEMLTEHKPGRDQIRAVIFDFDGTISTLRSGWEQVMRPLMIEMIGGGANVPGLERDVDAYIEESTGVQTIFQMRWLAEQTARHGFAEARDEWWYKQEYNRRLTAFIADRKAMLRSGAAAPGAFMIAGAMDFLYALRAAGLHLYVASGTDEADVIDEVRLLGLSDCFIRVVGAPPGRAACPKGELIRALMEDAGLTGAQLAVVGDGKVEIALGSGCGAFALGLASDEAHRSGVNETKRRKLTDAGASAIAGDFLDRAALLSLLLGT